MSTPKARILLISDDDLLYQPIQALLNKLPRCQLLSVGPSGKAIESVVDQNVDLVIFHAEGKYGHGEVCRTLKQIADLGLSLPTLVISEQHEPLESLQALRAGAADCLSRPLDLNRLRFLIDTLTLRCRFQRPPVLEVAAESDELSSHNLFGCSNPLTAAATDRLRKIAAHDITVLLTGETGVGKTRMARIIHEMSGRERDPFLTVNCAALPEHLLESELFGHRRGAFTGADADREGKFAAAKSGTLLLDEVDSLPLASQAKLLRVVDERVFEPVGSNKSLRCKARLIVATNRNLTAEVEAGRFRSDLYFRFNAASFQLPSLRERPAAIASIAEHFVEEFSRRAGMTPPHISAEAMLLMQTYRWPGNVRELRNAMERAVALCVDEVIYTEDLPENIPADVASMLADQPDAPEGDIPPATKDSTDRHQRSSEEFETTDSGIARLNPTLNELGIARIKGEMKCVVETLHRCNNNRSLAARELGISRAALYKKLHRFGLLNQD
ncbi:sigma-54-dependent transcriptional regulator [Roseiconus nitratireducens]|nr:sigma-54 dependent transcriptional regulator [Roseiconus nitratireducens]